MTFQWQHNDSTIARQYWLFGVPTTKRNTAVPHIWCLNWVSGEPSTKTGVIGLWLKNTLMFYLQGTVLSWVVDWRLNGAIIRTRMMKGKYLAPGGKTQGRDEQNNLQCCWTINGDFGFDLDFSIDLRRVNYHWHHWNFTRLWSRKTLNQ